jgi:hypothetical protein
MYEHYDSVGGLKARLVLKNMLHVDGSSIHLLMHHLDTLILLLLLFLLVRGSSRFEEIRKVATADSHALCMQRELRCGSATAAHY